MKKARAATEVDAHVGECLKSLRRVADLSQTELADQVGVTFQQIQKYERGINRIGASRLWSFSKILGVRPGRFFDGLEDNIAALKRVNADSSKPH